MSDRSKEVAEEPSDVADRKMLAEIKEELLGTDRREFFIGRFRVLERLGEGSMGVVFSAFDDRLKRRVALKLLHRGVGTSDDERKTRMLREAQVLAQLSHPNVVHVHEAGEHDGQIFMAMELVEGRPLDELQRARPDWKSLLDIYIAAGRGLAAAHAKGVVHRDVKPHNIIVDEEGRVRVVDFGLARESMSLEAQHTAELPLTDEGAIERSQLERLTATGAVPGTPAYMAPELFDGRPATAQSDQFSFCVALYEGIHGRRPFEGKRLQEVVAAANEGRILPPPPERPVPRWLFKAVARGLAAAPEDRYPSMDDLLAELVRERKDPRRYAWLSSAVVAIAGGAWWVGTLMGGSTTFDPGQALAAEQRRLDTCTEDVTNMRSRWQQARGRLPARPATPDDADDLAAVLDVGAERFFDRWAQSCLADATVEGGHCRMQARRQLEATLTLPEERPRDQDLFHDLAYELELCLEGGPSPCGAEPDAPAADALRASRAAELAGALDAALEHADRAIELAVSPSDQLTRLRAMLRKGALLEAAGSTTAARELLRSTFIPAVLCEADVLAIDIALEQAESEALHSGDPDRADLALAWATALLDRSLTKLPLRQARLLEKKGDVKLYLERHCTEAIALFESALAGREQAIVDRRQQGLSTAVPERLAADAQLNLVSARLYALIGYWPECSMEGLDASQVLNDLRKARERFANAVGSERHLDMAEYDFDSGVALLRLERPSEAVESFESALAIYDAHHGPTSLLSGEVHRALAAAHREARSLDEAERHAAEALEIFLSHEGEEGQPLALAQAHDALGVILSEAGRLDAARSALHNAIAVLTRAPADELTLAEHEHLRISYVNLALVEWDRHDQAGARRASSAARALKDGLSERNGAVEPDLAPERLIEAKLLLAAGKPGAALDRLVDAELLPGTNAAIEAAIADTRASALR